ncbi:MAG: glycosyltransferase family 4 protein [Gemmataceae bacterium]
MALSKKWVGMFSGLDPVDGGIQVSGRLAWNAISQPNTSEFICYGGTGDLAGLTSALNPVVNHNRLWLLMRLLKRNWNRHGVLVWHLRLLKLLKFMRGFRGKVVVYLHGIESWQEQSADVCRLLDRVDHFLSNTQFTWDRFLTYHPRLAHKTHTVVPLGMGSPWIGTTPRPDTKPIAVILGRMLKSEDYKGHRELINAWPLVLERTPHAELWIAGEGDLKPELEKMTQQKSLSQAIRFLGRINEEEKQKLLIQSRCLAMPSRGEGFGLVYLEAMRLGRPCLVSNQDAAREVVLPPQAGLAVDPGDLTAMALAMSALLSPGPAWDELSKSSRMLYESQFTASHFIDRLRKAVGFDVTTQDTFNPIERDHMHQLN